ncbi:type II secretion system protein N [Phenylobacterium sp.]|uniref:type II secretion system protein N n=1 Tax=Phenylobacterium sp. TaxID=1871053 RepID=UPI0035AF01B2
MGRVLPIFGVAFILAAAAMLPLRIALGWMDADQAGLSARAVEGAVWGGSLIDARFRGLRLGDARAGLDVVGGGLRLAADGELRGRGVVGGSAGGLSLRGVDAELSLERVAGGLPIGGRAHFRSFEAEFRRDGCRRAGGEVRLREVTLSGAPLAGLQLGGRASCQGGVLVVPLAGQSGGAAVDAVLRIDAAGRYQLDTRLRATDPVVQAAAAAAGFARGLDGFARTDRGRLSGA